MHVPASKTARFGPLLASFLLAFIAVLNTAHALGQQALLRAADVHDLRPELAARGLPVHLTATVTYYEPAEHTLFVADSSGAVYVKTDHPYPIQRGDRVRIDGFTAKSFRTTVALNPKMQVIGRGVISRENIRTFESYREMMAGKWDCQNVVMRGRIRSAVVENHGQSTVLELEIMMPGGIVQAFLQDYRGVDLKILDDAEVEMTGIVAGEFTAKWQLMRSILYGSDASDLHIIHAAPVPPASLPLTAIDNVTQTHSISDRSPRLRVRGVVTFYQPGNAIVIEQGDRSLFAATRQEGAVPVGSIVDVIGFAESDAYGPRLNQAEILTTGQVVPVTPLPVSYQQAMSGLYSDNLVSLRGRLIAHLHNEHSDTLSLLVDDHAVTAVLQASDGAKSLPLLPVGSEVYVAGICRVTQTGLWGTPGVTAMIFQVNMRNADDLKILALPSWWNVTHLLVVVCALLAISLIIACWVMVLRRRIAKQTATIQRTMRLEMERSRILEAINSESPLAELLAGVCQTAEGLVPGLQCGCMVDDLLVGCARTVFEAVVSRGHCASFKSPIHDSLGRGIGQFCAYTEELKTFSDYETKVLQVATNLAGLAVNQRRMFQELNYTSTHDQLTGLPNRRLSDAQLDAALDHSASTGARVAVAYIDVDRFKQVNDQHGHKTGDLYLQQIASRLSANVRIEDKLARIGGDEFLLVATSLRDSESATAYKLRLEQCFEEPFLLDGCVVHGSASIGIAVYPDHGSTAEDLKRHADVEMYTAKRARREGAGRRSGADADTEIFSNSDLETALANDSFILHYQPQFSPNGELRGFEALIRLNDPILGLVTPDAFIGVAERNDVILPLGTWVLNQALADAANWRIDLLPDVRMVVNVAARQVEQPDFAEQVLSALKRSHMPARCLEVEITERTLIRNTTEALSQLRHLQVAGVKVSIDDFGTEHSSLSAIHRFPIDTLKIDRSFVRVLQTEPEVIHIIRAIVSMGKSMNKRLVAEGVETLEDVETLLEIGAMDFQGFFFSRPQSAAIISERLQSWITQGASLSAGPSTPAATQAAG